MSFPRTVAALQQAASDTEAFTALIARTLRFNDSPLQDTTQITSVPTSQVAANTQMMTETPQTHSLQQIQTTIKQKQLKEMVSYLLRNYSKDSFGVKFNSELLLHCLTAHFENHLIPLQQNDFSLRSGTRADNTRFWYLEHKKSLSPFCYAKFSYPTGDTEEGLIHLIQAENRLVHGISYFTASQTRLEGTLDWFEPVKAMILMKGNRITLTGTEKRNFSFHHTDSHLLIGSRVRIDGTAEAGNFFYDEQQDTIIHDPQEIHEPTPGESHDSRSRSAHS